MSRIMYRTGGYRILIEPVQIERETEHSVWVSGNRSKKMSSWYCHFDSFEEAKTFLHKKAIDIVKRASDSLESAKNELKKIESLEETES